MACAAGRRFAGARNRAYLARLLREQGGEALRTGELEGYAAVYAEGAEAAGLAGFAGETGLAEPQLGPWAWLRRMNRAFLAQRLPCAPLEAYADQMLLAHTLGGRLGLAVGEANSRPSDSLTDGPGGLLAKSGRDRRRRQAPPGRWHEPDVREALHVGAWEPAPAPARGHGYDPDRYQRHWQARRAARRDVPPYAQAASHGYYD